MSGVKTETKTETQRITSLSPKSGKNLTSLEESVVRMHHGVSLKPSAKLASNGVNDEVMSKLLNMEVDAYEATGRIDDLDDVPPGATANKQTARIVSALGDIAGE